jgi:truncated hemoglobin YjbI
MTGAGDEVLRRRRSLQPHPELWRALGEGALLRPVLAAFYGRVYRDPRLAPFFHATTIEWAIDHQYAFLREILTGEKVFFGDRPRNAHHWMVISDELFDYREALFAACFRDYGVEERWIAELHAIHESYRSHIVKGAPFAKKRGGVALPLDGHERVLLTVGTCCDACGRAVEKGGLVWSHVRTGRTSCEPCSEVAGIAEGRR